MIHLLPWCGAGLIFCLYKIFPTSFNVLFLINIWLFSMPHTFSTFTRSDRRETKKVFLTLGLIGLFLVSIMMISQLSGMVVLYSLYFYWQQFHYGKQNLGVGQWRSERRAGFIDKSFYLIIVAMSLLGLLSGEPQAFFGYVLFSPLKLDFSNGWIFFLMLLFTVGYVLYRPEQLKDAFGHTLIFSVAYLYCEHFALGWLILNVFHNLQYLKFMQSFERKLSYLLLPLVLTFVLYLLQFHVFKGLILFSLPLSLGLMLALNFTHYTLDGLIWKKVALQRT